MPGRTHDALSTTLRRWRRAMTLARCADAAASAGVSGVLAAVVLLWLRIDAPWAIVVAAVVAGGIGYRRGPTLGRVAAMLDARFALDDLLTSAWAVRRADAHEPGDADDWRATVRRLAAARADALPPPGWLGRWSVRQHACAAAAVLMLWTAVRLLPTAAAPPTAVIGQATDHPPAAGTIVAGVRQRAADTADEATRIPAERPAEAVAANASADRRATPGDSAGAPTTGDGRADAPTATAPPSRSPAGMTASTPAPRVGGSGTAGLPNGNGAATGRVTAARPAAAGTAVTGAGSADRPDATPAADRTTNVPEPYRAMVKAFFEH